MSAGQAAAIAEENALRQAEAEMLPSTGGARVAVKLAKAGRWANVDMTWLDRLQRKGKNEDPDSPLLSCEHNALLILQNDPELKERGIAFDSFLGRVVYRDRPASDEDTTEIAVHIQDRYDFATLSVSTVRRAMQLHAKGRRTDALIAHVESLPPHDGVARLDTWLTTYANAKDAKYTRLVGRKFVLQMLARALRPGCKADIVLVLVGPQGARKSSLAEALACRPDFFADEIADLQSKEAVMSLFGKWIVELAEMDTTRRASSERVKKFLSARTDHFVPKFANEPIDVPRRSVFVATTNDGEVFADSTGNRRFWPVTVKDIDIEAMRRDAPQLLAEGLVAFRAGESWWFDAEQEKLALPHQEAHRIVDAWEPIILPWLDAEWPEGHHDAKKQGKLRADTGITVAEVLGLCLGIQVAKFAQADQNRTAKILQRAGWVRRKARIVGGREWRYFPQTSAEHDEPVPVGPVDADDTGTADDSANPGVVPSGPSYPTTNSIYMHAHARTHARLGAFKNVLGHRDNRDTGTTQAGVCPHCGRRHGAEVGCDGSPTGAK